ncbi:hypothetical protein [Helicobacter pylori]|uniref:hypothetical protein n=1 Tax=Helicobacter pylori TaxID=210 RepID=UPI000EAC8242|nr:hypothetical protein [Helicobacter pylori]
MWNEKTIKIIPSLLFLFCLLEVFELVLIVNDMNKAEKLESKIKDNLKALEHFAILLNDHLECMDLKYPKDKKIKIK